MPTALKRGKFLAFKNVGKLPSEDYKTFRPPYRQGRRRSARFACLAFGFEYFRRWDMHALWDDHPPPPPPPSFLTRTAP